MKDLVGDDGGLEINPNQKRVNFGMVWILDMDVMENVHHLHLVTKNTEAAAVHIVEVAQ